MSYIAPSWSWASINGSVTYKSKTLFNDGRPKPQEQADLYDFGDFQVLDTHVQPSSFDQFAAISKGAFVELRGRMKLVRVTFGKLIKDKQDDDGFRNLQEVGGHDGAVGGCIPIP